MTEPYPVEFSNLDISNLKFILVKREQGEDCLDEWLESLNEDDLEYTLTLLQAWTSAQKSLVNRLC